MALYGFVDPANTVLYIADTKTIDPTVQTKPGYRWLPVTDEARPAYDTATQIAEGPFLEVRVSDIRRYYTIRNLSPSEQDTIKTDKVNAMDFVILRVLYNHENRIRTLAGQANVTIDQFKTAIKSLI